MNVEESLQWSSHCRAISLQRLGILEAFSSRSNVGMGRRSCSHGNSQEGRLPFPISPFCCCGCESASLETTSACGSMELQGWSSEFCLKVECVLTAHFDSYYRDDTPSMPGPSALGNSRCRQKLQKGHGKVELKYRFRPISGVVVKEAEATWPIARLKFLTCGLKIMPGTGACVPQIPRGE